MAKERKSLANTFSLVAIVTVASKLVGLIRDIVLLQAFGTSLISDAYNYANLFTGNFFILFGGLGGPFHTSSVAILTPLKDKPNNEMASTIGQIVFYTFIVLLVLTFIGYWLSPNLVRLIIPGTSSNANFIAKLWQETTLDLRIMLPLIILAGLIGIVYGIMNILDKYFLPSISPAVSSLVLILTVLVFGQKLGGLSLALGTLLGAFGQFIIQAYILAGYKFNDFYKIGQNTVSFFKMLWPAAIGTSVGQLNIYVDSFFTSQLHEGSWTAIVNANRLVQLPLGVLLTAMLVPILPRFTTYVYENKTDLLKNEFNKALKILFFLSLPLGAILFALKTPIIEILFERGAFNETSKALIVTALTYLIPSIFFYVARDLITRVFYAHKDTKTPYYIALFAIFTNFIFDYLLVKPLGIGGITLSTTIVTFINLCLLYFFIIKKIGSLNIRSIIKPVTIMIFSSLSSAIICYWGWIYIIGLISNSYGLVGFVILKFVCVGILGMAGIIIYLFFCYILKLDEIAYALKYLQNKLKIS